MPCLSVSSFLGLLSKAPLLSTGRTSSIHSKAFYEAAQERERGWCTYNSARLNLRFCFMKSLAEPNLWFFGEHLVLNRAKNILVKGSANKSTFGRALTYKTYQMLQSTLFAGVAATTSQRRDAILRMNECVI